MIRANADKYLRSSRQEHLATASQLAAARLEIERLELELKAALRNSR